MPPDGARSVLRGEILEQPAAVARFLERETRNAALLAALWRRADIPFVLIAARGTSDNAARYAQYAFGLASRLPVALAAPSLVTLYGVPPRLKGALVIGISQSGRSPDIVETVAAARRAGSTTRRVRSRGRPPRSCLSMRAKSGASRRRRRTRRSSRRSPSSCCRTRGEGWSSTRS